MMWKKCCSTCDSVGLSWTGEVVGAYSFSIGHGVSLLKKVASARMLHQANDMQNVASYQLRRKVIFPLKYAYWQGCIIIFGIFLKFTHYHLTGPAYHK